MYGAIAGSPWEYSIFNSIAGDLCVHEEAEAGVACIPACLTIATCRKDSCPASGSGHVDMCGLYPKNKTLEFSNLRVISTGLDCRGISQHVTDICSSILGKT